MKLSVQEIFQDSTRNNYAVAAVNANGATYDIARAAFEAARECDIPIIIQAYEHNIKYRGLNYFVTMVDFLGEEFKVPYTVFLDHGCSIDVCMQAARAGFTGVMIDNEGKSLEENIDVCNEMIKYLHPMGVSLEAEIGQMAQQEALEKGTALSEKSDVEKFLNCVDVDLLAISVGTSHGIHKNQDDNINYDLIREIRTLTDIPLVQHGTNGVSLDALRKLVEAGMQKINFGEDFRLNYIKYYNQYSQELNHSGHTWKIMEAVKERLKKDMMDIFHVLYAK